MEKKATNMGGDKGNCRINYHAKLLKTPISKREKGNIWDRNRRIIYQ